MKKMKVAICVIGTGKYLDYFPKYYENIEKYFIPDSEKTILLFTDGKLNHIPDNVKVYDQEHLPLPYRNLKKFEIINKAREEILKHDHFVFLAIDFLVVKEIPDRLFYFRCCSQNMEQVPFFGVQHPCHYLQIPPHDKYPGAWDQNIRSEAYVDLNDDENPVAPNISGQFYLHGSFWGGTIPSALHMIDELEGRVNRDLENGIIAIENDESHLNKYFIERPFDINAMSSMYAYHEDLDEQNIETETHGRILDKFIVRLTKDNSKY